MNDSAWNRHCWNLIRDEGQQMGRPLALVAVSSALRVNVGYTVMW